jgi:hypothetical protein
MNANNFNNVKLAQIYGVVIGALAILGLFTEGHLLNLMNVDAALDGLRVVLGAALLYIGFGSKNNRQATIALLVVGVVYILTAILGLIDPKLFGMLPSGLTGFDIAFHLITGAVAAWAGLRKSAELSPAR